MRLIDAEMIKIPTSMMHNIDGCYMLRVEDVQRIISEQTTAFDKEKVIDELRTERNPIYREDGSLMSDKTYISIDNAIEIVEKGGIE